MPAGGARARARIGLSDPASGICVPRKVSCHQNFEAAADCQEGAAGGGASPLLIFWRMDLSRECTVIYPLFNRSYPLA